MQNDPNETEIARSNSWKTVEMPATVISLPFTKTYTAEEFSVLAHGFVPKAMEDKWFVFMQDNILFFHRSWTGLCIYKIVFEQNHNEYTVQEVLINADTEQYSRRDNHHETTLLSWLIDGYLLRKQVSFPVPGDLSRDTYPGVF